LRQAGAIPGGMLTHQPLDQLDNFVSFVSLHDCQQRFHAGHNDTKEKLSSEKNDGCYTFFSPCLEIPIVNGYAT